MAEALVLEPSELLRNDGVSAELAALGDAALHERLERSQRELRSLGSVDYGVLAEYGTLRDRYAFLTEQLDDLARAEAEIRQGMGDVRERIQEQFATAFATSTNDSKSDSASSSRVGTRSWFWQEMPTMYSRASTSSPSLPGSACTDWRRCLVASGHWSARLCCWL